MTPRICPAWLLLLAGLLVVASGCSDSAGVGASNPPGPPSAKLVDDVDPNAPGFFRDMTKQAGIDFTYWNGEKVGDHFAILDSLGGGTALIDYNRDGRLDVFFTGGGTYSDKKEILGHPSRLYRNDGDWKFTDVTREVGLDKPLFYTHGGAVGDYDKDGWPDLLVTGYGRLALYRNNHGKFEDVTEPAGLKDNRDLHWSTSAGFADLDGDGHLDLYVTHYVDWHLTKNNPTCRDSTGERRDVCSPKQFKPIQHALFHNQGNGTFKDVTQEAGIIPGKGLGVCIGDLNHDRKPDIYVANDTEANYLYINRSSPGTLKFEEQAGRLAAALDENGVGNGSMGVDFGDYDGSGHFSVFVTNYQHESHALYRNKGSGPFLYVSPRAGITGIGLVYVAFGTVFIDYDNDGPEDLFISNGHVVRYPPPPGTLMQKPVLLRNLRKPGDRSFDVRFEEVSKKAGPYFHAKHMGRGVASGDLDNDGRVDLVLNHMNEPVVLLRNEVDNGNHWLGVGLVGKTSPEAVGAELILEVGGQKLARSIRSGRSYLSSCDPRVVFGLGKNDKVDKLTIKWPSGTDQTIPGDELKPDRYYQIVEGEKPVAVEKK
jgi:hypothetical protein